MWTAVILFAFFAHGYFLRGIVGISPVPDITRVPSSFSSHVMVGVRCLTFLAYMSAWVASSNITRMENSFLMISDVFAARLADSAVHKKDVGVCTFAHPELGPSHCPSTRISNAASARQMNIQCSHVKTWCMNIHRMWTFPLPYLPVDFKVAKFEFSR